MNRKASPELIAAILRVRAEMSAKATYAALGTTSFAYMRVVDGLPVQESVIRRIETKLAERAGLPAPALCTLVGQRFGRLVVTSEATYDAEARQTTARVRCDCGTEKTMRVDALRRRSRAAKSCGCGREPMTTSPHVKVENGRVLYEAFGRWQTAAEWCAETGVPVGTFRERVMAYGRTPEVALTMSRVKRGTFVLGRRAS
jgi:hypothetical protein